MAIAQAGVDMTWRVRIGQQRVGHVVERLWQPTTQLLPRIISALAEDAGIRLPIDMRGGHRLSPTCYHTRSRHEPHLGARWVGGHGPAVMPIKTTSRLSPGRSGIAADG